MKNQYFGDVNDYRKYGLLRILTGYGQLGLGVCWMLTPDDGRSDGKFIEYLSNPKKWRPYDPRVFDSLQWWVIDEGARHVQKIQNATLLPGAKFYDELLTDNATQRSAYFQQMRQHLAGSELIFYDPDNGIEVKSKPPGRKDSSKYINWDELRDTFNAGQSVLFYQHFRREERASFIQRMKTEITTHTGAAEIYSFQTPQVVYFLMVQEKHAEYMASKIKQVAETWGAGNQILAG